jgi:hypothetical protein
MEATNGLFVYSYHHDDDMQGWTRVSSFRYVDYNGETQGLTPEFIENVTVSLKACGWEGDGALEAMSVPPFFGENGFRDWFAVFHVKQVNNGTSWIASERRLSVNDLNEEAATKKR